MKLFCASSTVDFFTEGEFYDAEYRGDVVGYLVKDNDEEEHHAFYDDESGFIVLEVIGGDFVEFE